MSAAAGRAPVAVVAVWRPPLWLDRLGGITWRFVIIVAGAALLVAGIVAMSTVILPVVLGLLFTCGLRPVAERLRRLGMPPSAAAAVAVLALLVAVILVAWLTVRVVVDEWDEITDLLAAGQTTLVDASADTGIDDATAASIGADVSSFVASGAGLLLTGVVHVVPTIAGIVTTTLLAFVVAFFYLKDGPPMWRWILGRVGASAELTDRTGRRVWNALTGFVLGQTVIAAVDATLIAVGAVVLGVPQPLAIFVLTFFGAYVPFIGAFLSGMVAVLLALGDGGTGAGVAMLAIVLGVQVLEGNVLQPWIQGRAVRLHPLVIALAVTAGGAIAGFLGVFLAVPVTAGVFVALSELRRGGILGPPDPVPPPQST